MNTLSFYKIDLLRGVCQRITEAEYAHHAEKMDDPGLLDAYAAFRLVRVESPWSLEPGPVPTPEAA